MDLSDHELEFPCQYPIKVIGKANEDFKRSILQIVHGHFEQKVSDDLISFKHSRNNKYLSITIDFEAKSRQHVDNIYKDLKACNEVVYLM
ncbi:MAG: hypothetical protein S4CHLAM6_02800 [Chlamydiae bacterium]|nr:hypothetical protein [Chlamydiota bacterium]